MKIASFPPTKPRPSTHDAARHINEEARLVLASLRGGPPYVARGELALGLRELRGYVRGRLFLDNANNDGVATGGGGGGIGENGDYYSNSSVSNLGGASVVVPMPPAAASAATTAVSVVKPATPRSEEGEEDDNDNNNEAAPPQIRIPPPPSPVRGEATDGGTDGNQLQMKGSLPPPPLPAITDEEKNDHANNNGEATASAGIKEEPAPPEQQRPFTPPSSPTRAVSPPTPHSVPPPSSPDQSTVLPAPPLLPMPDLSQHSRMQQQQQQQQQQQPLDPGPYATPFLAVIVDPRAAGPHTLVALRALHRLLERGSIVQLTRGGSNTTKPDSSTASPKQASSSFVHETTLEPIARGVLACRFEQTDAGADEAVEMAIADLLKLLVELDAAGARAAEAALLRQVYANKAQKRAAELQQQSQSQQQQTQTTTSNQNNTRSNNNSNNKQRPTTGTMIRIQRLPSSILMESFHAVYVTRHTFVRDGGGHHSPALSFHFEQVLLRMIHCVFGGEDAQSSLSKKGGMMSSRHVSAARKILEFLIDSMNFRKAANNDSSGGNKWNTMMMDGSASDDGRTLCLRLIQCCLRTGWGNDAEGKSTDNNKDSSAATSTISEDDKILSRLIEDDLCLALLTAGQAIWAHNDKLLLTTPNSSSSASADMMGTLGSPNTSLELLSEVCATLSLLWSLSMLRSRLRSQFESIFTGFYQRALSLLRRRPLPEYGVIYEANMVFDAEAEMILESLVDVLCLSSNGGGSDGGTSLSTIEELFLTYDCSTTESDVASGLLVELSRCCGGVVDEEGEPYLPSSMSSSLGLSRASSKSGSSGAPPPRSNGSDAKNASSAMLIPRHRSVPDHLKELCFEALLGSLRRLFHGAESLGETSQVTKDGSPTTSVLRTAKNEKRRLHNAAQLFNEKSKNGLSFLSENSMLPSPPTPASVASFLRNGLVVGLNKAAVGQYLGELGKSPKNTTEKTPVYEQDWFHVELLASFCSSFAFDQLTVLDGLRMFLATFRLPGEAQMIDRILQAFAESISRRCVESSTNGRVGCLKLFSTDEKRASDAAYLLSFSIIMLNTDLHNENIRADRKMKMKDFVKYNTNYGKEISDKDLPAEYLEGIYRSIKEEQIRTLGEGADGSMTGERWKDVMRSASSSTTTTIRSRGDAKDLKELILESSWQPILSAVSGLWGMVPWEVYQADVVVGGIGAAGGGGTDHPNGTTSLLGARLGIDLAYEMLSGASGLGRPDVFQDVFTNICYMSGLLSEYNRPTDQRAHNFLHSIEHQSALTVAVSIAEENGDMIGLDGWKCVWGMVFELRDFRLLNGGEGKRRRQQRGPNVMKESDPDLLSPEARDDFRRRMAHWDDDGYDEVEGGVPKRQSMSLMSFVFGSSETLDEGKNTKVQKGGCATTRSLHGKEEFLVWDDLASSDEEEEEEEEERNNSSSGDTEYLSFPSERSRRISSIGAAFENQLIYESTLGQEVIGGVTGLERIDIIGHSSLPKSLRARVRQRLSQLVDFHGLIAESRYLSEEGLSDTLNSLVEIIRDSSKKTNSSENGDEEALVGLPLSPASEAFAEILLCEIALKNRDRFALVWNNILRAHYNSRLTYRPSSHVGGDAATEGGLPPSETIKLTPGTEKCVTGILRLCAWTSNGRDTAIANQVLSTLKILHPPFGALIWSPLELNLDKHLAEGLWHISRNVDGLSQIDGEGWSGILGLVEWCATRGGLRSKNDQLGSLAEDDPSLQAFRSLHLILHAVELKDSLQVYRWPQIVRSVRCLVEAGERGHCPKLSIAGLDLLQVLHTRMESLAAKEDGESQHLLNCWVPILEAIGEPAEKSRNGSVRQQAISLLTDILLDRHGSRIPVDSGLCEIMNTICIPLAGKRITDLLRIPYDVQNDLEETLIELELCISLLFKPFLHHLKALISVKHEFVGIWISMLGIMTQLLGEESSLQNEEDDVGVREDGVTRAKLFQTTKELGSEHLRNAIMVLAAMGVLIDDEGDDSTKKRSDDAQEISAVTWAAIGSIGYCKPYLEEWKSSACQ
eukprot:CAMPEP_0201921956 /NCGR_PEP_ID=MMETSP0903-20130614/10133_1 /ASSEMBLY_ACC=CAM_ASM_000552 /TAXON_ID=420261 /ORGANISM="Thalassiosira antarctica, Strain CCMP982" /LENGTH=2026 /DNA_ID=CAMNT_0048459001 /DNA_START=149 /DNA_END=6229 /DNA_ORIENTATION=+